MHLPVNNLDTSGALLSIFLTDERIYGEEWGITVIDYEEYEDVSYLCGRFEKQKELELQWEARRDRRQILLEG